MLRGDKNFESLPVLLRKGLCDGAQGQTDNDICTESCLDRVVERDQPLALAVRRNVKVIRLEQTN